MLFLKFVEEDNSKSFLDIKRTYYKDRINKIIFLFYLVYSMISTYLLYDALTTFYGCDVDTPINFLLTNGSELVISVLFMNSILAILLNVKELNEEDNIYFSNEEKSKHMYELLEINLTWSILLIFILWWLFYLTQEITPIPFVRIE